MININIFITNDHEFIVYWIDLGKKQFLLCNNDFIKS